MQMSRREKDILNERLAKIEKQNQRLKYGLVFVIAAFLVAGILGAKAVPGDGHFNHILAKSITIVDDAGSNRVLIAASKDGTGMDVLDKNGRTIVGIGITADETGSGLLVADTEGRPRVGLGVDEGVPSLAIADADGKKIIALGGGKTGYGLVVMDKMETERVGLGYKAGNVGVAIFDDQGKYVRGMIRQKDGVHYLSFIDENGKEVIRR